MTQSALTAARTAAPRVQFEGWTSVSAPKSIEGPQDGARAVPPLLDLVRKASDAGADAIIIACFDDTGLAEAQAIAACPVIGIGQASYVIASLLAGPTAVITTVEAAVPVIKANIKAQGQSATVRHVEAADVPVLTLTNSPAVALAKSGLRIALVDSQDPRSEPATRNRRCVDDFSARVSAITPANAKWLDDIGVWTLLKPEQVQPYANMEVWEQLGSGRIQFDALDYQRTCLGYIIENSALLGACFEALDAVSDSDMNTDLQSIDYFFDARIRAIHFNQQQKARELIFEGGPQLSAQLLIGADGANSFVRRALNIPTREWDYQQSAIVCTVETEKPHEATAWQRFSERGPVAYLPLRDTLKQDSKSTNTFQRSYGL